MIKKMAFLSVFASLISVETFSINLGYFRLSLFRATIMIALLLSILHIIKQNGILALNANKNKYSIQFFVAWLIYSVMSLGWVKDYGSWVKAVCFIAIGLICVLVYSKYFKTSHDILMAFRFIAIWILIHNIIGWYEIYTGNYIFLSADRILRYARNNYPVSMFHNTNNYATFMLFSVFINYVCAVNSKRGIVKTIYFTTMISSIILLFLTKSRANIIGLVMAFSVYLCLMDNRKVRLNIIILVMVLYVIMIFVPSSTVLSLQKETLYFNFSLNTGSDSIRLNLLKNGFSFLVCTLGFGTGAGNIEYWMDNYPIFHTGNILNIHNWWMEILSGYGLIIFILYIIFYIKLFSSMYKRYKTSCNKLHRSISLSIMCCMSGFIVGSISSSSNIPCEWLWVFWAICIAFQGIEEKR